jgi:hypothetical protein
MKADNKSIGQERGGDEKIGARQWKENNTAYRRKSHLCLITFGGRSLN